MNRNVGSLDRKLRLAVGVVVLIAAFVIPMGSVLQAVAVIAGVIALGTASVSYCPLYRLLGINTCQVR